MRLNYHPYRLLFKHPFTTAHGTRTGTDSVFVRLEEDGVVGFGEVTLPPYLNESQAEVIKRLEGLDAAVLKDAATLARALNDSTQFPDEAPGFRCAVQMAWADLMARKAGQPLYKWLGVPKSSTQNRTLVTLGASAPSTWPSKLKELPESGALKLKVEDETDIDIIRKVSELDSRMLFIDANQGLSTLDAAQRLVGLAGARLLGLEQPFPVDATEQTRLLQRSIGIPVYGDESIQDVDDLERLVGVFGGVNIKLVKCGGLDRAKVIGHRAAALGLKAMLGNMSESSLGCTAAAHLSGLAELIDLDGPLLIRNDPFKGATMAHGRLKLPEGPGIGAALVADFQFSPICT